MLTAWELLRETAKAFKPPPRLKISEWADNFRKLSPESSAEPGQWRTSRAEYQRGIMDAPNDLAVERIVVMSSAQIGKTSILENLIGYFISQDPAPILLVQPTLEMAETFSKDRLVPMLRDTPILQDKVTAKRTRDSSNNILHKQFPGGHITMAGANSPASLASRPIRIVIGDEIDRWGVSAGSEGDPVNLAIKRTTTFWNRRIALVSTPTIKGASRIETAFLESDRCYYYVPCPHCQHEQILIWGQVKWDKDSPSLAWYECEGCQKRIDSIHKSQLIRLGRWKPTAEFKGIRGFHICELYSPWRTFGDVVVDFLAAKDNPEMLKVWVNTSLGETFDEDGGEGLEWQQLAQRAEPYQPLSVPSGGLLLTAGVDVQGDRLSVAIWAWGKGEESWLIYWVELYGDPTESKVWEELDTVLGASYTHESGTELKITAACIDSGFKPQEVYNYVRKRPGRNLFAVKGQSTPGKPVIGKPTLQEVTYKGQTLKKGVKLWPVGSDVAKGIIYSRLRIRSQGAGYVHFPLGIDEEFYEQLTAEKLVTRYVKGFPKREWVKTRARNEGLDCFDGQTEVLTSGGWKFFKEIEGTELFATVNLKTDQIEYQLATDKIQRWHEGEMIQIKGRRIDILVTPNHRMVTYRKEYIGKGKERRWNFDVPPQFTNASDLTIRHTLKVAASWRGVDFKKIIVPASYTNGQNLLIEPERAVDAGDLASFLGWYVSEGWTSMIEGKNGSIRRRVGIAQNRGAKQDKIINLLERLPWKWHFSKENVIIFSSKQLYDFVQDCGKLAEGKKVPQWIKNSTPEIISRFLESAILGDGWITYKPNQRPFRTYSTVSKQLADDIQELFIKTGCASNIKVKPALPYKVGGRSGTNTLTQYHVTECKVARASLDGGGNGKRELLAKAIPFSGEVYCVSVPNSTLICRRNGKSFIAGNCTVYAYAAAVACGLVRLDWRKLEAAIVPADTEEEEKPMPPPEPPPKQGFTAGATTSRRKGNFATSW